MPGPGEPSAPLVFVSSTVEDFRDLRSALRFWLGSLGYRLFMSEYSGSDKVLGPGTYDACFEAISRADLYVLLIGARRGSLISEEPQCSITEAEYDFAYRARQDSGRPMLLLFVRDEVARDIRRENPELEYQDVEHTRSFVDKVERVAETTAAREGQGDPPADNWLHRFREFADIATEIDSALGITGSVREARQRDLLRDELAEVLQRFVGALTMSFRKYFDAAPAARERFEALIGRSIPETLLSEENWLPRVWHRDADGVFGPLVDLRADPMGSVGVTERRVALQIASFSLVVASYAAIEFPRLHEASRTGLFRRYDPQSRATVATDLQQAVDLAQRELREVRSFAREIGEAPARVRAQLAPLSSKKVGSVELRRSDIAELAGLHNSVHNVVVRLVTLLRALQGANQSPLPRESDLRPHSPYPGMDKEVARERSTREEILAWAQSGLLEVATGITVKTGSSSE